MNKEIELARALGAEMGRRLQATGATEREEVLYALKFARELIRPADLVAFTVEWVIAFQQASKDEEVAA